MLNFFNYRREVREEKRLRLQEPGDQASVKDVSEGSEDFEQTSLEQTKEQLSDKQKDMLRSMKKSLKDGIFDLRYQDRSFTKRATPFMFPDA